jgi:DNA (cytosine-5)-methyltransferase 1
MRYVSVCSGVEAASVAWHDLGWTPVAFSEIEPFPSAVLKHRFPNVPNLGDMTKYKEWPIEPGTVDVLVGGTPCQSFSVAGLRKGLDDPRGNLMLVYLGLAEHFRIPWLVWENVPGVLSSNGGRDFGTFLGALGQLGYRWSYRVLDAQYFGVPQRRRRVFVVASLGDRPHPAKVLFEPESLRGDTAKSGKARKGAPRGARQGAPSGGRVNAYRMTAFGQYADDDSASTCKQRDHKDATDLVVTATGPVTQLPIGLDEEQNAVVDGFGTLKARMLGGGFEGTVAVSATGPVTHALTVSDGATEDGTGRGTPIVPVAFHPTQDPISSTGATHALGTGSKGGCATVAVATEVVAALTASGRGVERTGESRGQDPVIAYTQPTMAVRRLLPVECERLQGFPDGWTDIYPKKATPDGPRYKTMGNSMAVPVMRWIGTRLDALVKGTL